MKGFTLIEILVVMAITVVMSGLLVSHFNRASIDLTQTRTLVQDAVREAQSLALSGAAYGESYRCGYGVHFEAQTYTVFAGPDAEATDCSLFGKTYEPGTTEDVRVGIIPNPSITIDVSVDIFFEPPKPTTYLDGSSEEGDVDIRIIQGNGVCGTDTSGRAVSSDDCRIINVTTSGLITAR